MGNQHRFNRVNLHALPKDVKIRIGRKVDQHCIVYNCLRTGPDVFSSQLSRPFTSLAGTEHGRPPFGGGCTKIFDFHIGLLSHSAFDRARGQALNNIFLCKHIDNHYRQHGKQK